MQSNIPSSPKRIAVCMLTSSHMALDNRIYDKEAKSLADAGYSVAIIGQHPQREVRDEIQFIPLPAARTRFQRLVLMPFRLWKLALRQRAAIYHFHDPELIPLGLLLKLRGKHVIYDVHEDYEQTMLAAAWIPRPLRWLVSRLWGGCERLGSRCFDHVIVVDSQIRRKFPASKTTMITNVPPLAFLGESKPAEDDGKFRVLFIGAIQRARGIHAVLQALDLVKSPHVELHVVGQVLDPRLQESLNTNPRVVCHGRLPWKQVRAVLEQARLGLMLFQPTPAHLRFTGEGNTKLFEFMSLGLPVLFSDFPILRQFIYSIGAGFAVDPTSPEKIAAAIDHLCRNPELCRKMGERGQQAVRTQFHWEAEAKKLLAAYEGVMSGRQDTSGVAP